MCHSKFSCILISIVLFLLTQFDQPVVTCAQENFCDPHLERSATDPLGYKPRGNRCEGRYIQEVAGTPLFVASLTESFENYDLTSGEDLIVDWTVPPNSQTTHIRAYGLRSKLFYQMDTALPSGSNLYNWPADILAALDISSRDIGVIGWTRQTIGQNEQVVYVPLRISQKNPPTPSLSYQVILMLGRELTEVYISLAPVEDDGQLGKFIKDGEALGYGFYPAERGVEFELSNLSTPGLYYLEIGATLKSGGSTTIELWFYYFG